jgi:hypothetical protein
VKKVSSYKSGNPAWIFYVTIEEMLLLGRNTLLVPIFRGCFQFGPYVLKAFNWVPVFLSHYQFYL